MTTTSFRREVQEHPAVLRELIAHYRGDGQQLLQDWASRAVKAGRVLFSGMGASEYPPEAIFADLSANGVDASTADAGELIHYPQSQSGLVTLISQSGESIETRKLAERFAGTELAVIVNNEDSAMGRSAGLVLPMLAGSESTISTKTYSNTQAVLYLMAQAVKGQGAIESGLAELERLATAIAVYNEADIEHAARLLSDASCLHMISRGPALVAAKQCALTFMEGPRLNTAAFTGGAFRHGPFEVIEDGHRCIFLIPQGNTKDLLQGMATEVAQMGSQVVVITNTDLNFPEACVVLDVPACCEMLFPLAAATTHGLLADSIARLRGLRTGDFRYGGKVTERE
jgi:glucosamine--fructose-6-phosphate aminotransferase (isomerizing)